jgi:uncharacterized membrane protein
MSETKKQPRLMGAFALGFGAGMRSQLPLALIGWRIRQLEERGDNVRLPSVLRSTWFAPVATILAAGEFVGDKLPITPSRLNLGPLIGRFVIGGLSGAIAASFSKQSPAMGALAGAIGALGGAFAGYHARKAVVRASGVPDPVVAVAEDAIALGISANAIRALPTH